MATTGLILLIFVFLPSAKSGNVMIERNETSRELKQRITCSTGTVTCLDFQWSAPDCSGTARQYVMETFNRKCYNKSICEVSFEKDDGRFLGVSCQKKTNWTDRAVFECTQQITEMCNTSIATGVVGESGVFASINYPKDNKSPTTYCERKIGEGSGGRIRVTILDCDSPGKMNVTMNGKTLCDSNIKLPFELNVTSGSVLKYVSKKYPHRYGGLLATYTVLENSSLVDPTVTSLTTKYESDTSAPRTDASSSIFPTQNASSQAHISASVQFHMSPSTTYTETYNSETSSSETNTLHSTTSIPATKPASTRTPSSTFGGASGTKKATYEPVDDVTTKDMSDVQGQSQGVRHGLAIGIPIVVVVLLIVIIAVFFKRYRDNKENASLPPSSVIADSQKPSGIKESASHDSPVVKVKAAEGHELQYADLDFPTSIDEEKSREEALKRKEEDKTNYAEICATQKTSNTDAGPPANDKEDKPYEDVWV